MEKEKMSKNRFTKIIIISSLVMLAFFVFVPVASAFTGRDGDVVNIKKGEVINDDLYVTGREIVVDGTIKGDLVVFGKSVTVNGTVEGDLLGFAQQIDIAGNILGDVRAAGAVITLEPESKVNNDLVSAGYCLNAKSGSFIGKDMLFAGYQGSVASEITRNAKFAAWGLDIKGSIGGDLNAEVAPSKEPQDFDLRTVVPDLPEIPDVRSGMTVDKEAKIGGSVTYTSKEEIVFPDGIPASGKITHLLPKPDSEDTKKVVESTPQSLAMAWLLDNLRFVIAMLIVGLLCVWLIPQWVKLPADKLAVEPWPSLGWGFLSFISYWVLASIAVAAVLLIGIFLGVFTLGGLCASVIVGGLASLASITVVFLLVAAYFSKVIVSYWVGQFILNKTNPQMANNKYAIFFVGLAILVILAAIPLLGGVIKAVVTLFGLGALCLVLWAAWKEHRNPTPV